MRCFSNSEIVWSISLELLLFRLQPIFEDVTKLSATGAVDFASPFHNVFESQILADYIAARNKMYCDSRGD